MHLCIHVFSKHHFVCVKPKNNVSKNSVVKLFDTLAQATKETSMMVIEYSKEFSQAAKEVNFGSSPLHLEFHPSQNQEVMFILTN
jgi:lauroyl/myristoyl acyltransferase